jgi:hypothetical protein
MNLKSPIIGQQQPNPNVTGESLNLLRTSLIDKLKPVLFDRLKKWMTQCELLLYQDMRSGAHSMQNATAGDLLCAKFRKVLGNFQTEEINLELREILKSVENLDNWLERIALTQGHILATSQLYGPARPIDVEKPDPYKFVETLWKNLAREMLAQLSPAQYYYFHTSNDEQTNDTRRSKIYPILAFVIDDALKQETKYDKIIEEQIIGERPPKTPTPKPPTAPPTPMKIATPAKQPVPQTPKSKQKAETPKSRVTHDAPKSAARTATPQATPQSRAGKSPATVPDDEVFKMPLAPSSKRAPKKTKPQTPASKASSEGRQSDSDDNDDQDDSDGSTMGDGTMAEDTDASPSPRHSRRTPRTEQATPKITPVHNSQSKQSQRRAPREDEGSEFVVSAKSKGNKRNIQF